MALVVGSTTGLVVVDVSEGSKVVNLPSISQLPGRVVTIKDNGSASATKTITLVPSAGNTFESGDASYFLNAPFGYVTFIGDSSTLKWRVVGKSYSNSPSGTSTEVSGDASLTSATVSGPLLVTGQATLGNTSNTGTLAVAGNTTLGMLTATNINFTGSLMSNGTVFSGGSSTAGINSSGNVGIGGAAGSATLLVSGSQSNTGALGVAGNTTVTGMLAVSGQTILGNTSNTGTLGVAGAVSLGSLSVTGQTTLGNTSNTGTLGVAGAVSVGSLSVTGQTTLGNTSNTGTLGVAGNTTLGNTSNTGNLGVAGLTSLASATVSTLDVSGLTSLASATVSTLDVSGLATLVNSSNTGSLGVAGEASFGSATVSSILNTHTLSTSYAYIKNAYVENLSANVLYVNIVSTAITEDIASMEVDNANVSSATISSITAGNVVLSALSVSGQTTLVNSSNTGTLGVAGATTLASVSATSLSVSGQTTLVNSSNTGTLGVAGATTLAGTLGVTGLTTLVNSSNTGTLGVAGATTLASASVASLSVSGQTTLVNSSNTGTLGVAGATSLGSATVAGTLSVTGLTTHVNSSNTGTLGVAGATTLASASAASLSVSGQTTLGNTSNTGTLGVAGNTTLAGTLTANNINFTGSLMSNGTVFSGGAVSGINSSGNVGIGGAAGSATLLVSGSQSNTGTLGVAGNITAARYTANGGNSISRIGGVYNRGNDAESSSYQTINWVPGDYNSGGNWNVFDTTSQGAAGVFCSSKAGLGKIDFFVKNSPVNSSTNNNGLDFVGGFTSSGFNVTGTLVATNGFYGRLGINQWIHSTENRARMYFAGDGDTYFQSGAGYGFRNRNDVTVFSVSDTGNGYFSAGLIVNNVGFSNLGGGNYFGASTGNTIATYGAGLAAISINAPQGWIYSGAGFMTTSDERIKKNIVPATDSLDIVNKLNLVSYDYIDFNKISVKHGLIAQQVKQVYPEAVIKTKDYIPSVFNIATSYTNTEGNITVTSSLPTGFSVKDNIRLYISEDADYTSEEKYDTEVLEIISDTQFVVKAWDKFTVGQNLFIYGKEVDDFLAIDKPLIGLLAAGACQKLSGQVSTLQSENLELRSTIAAILQKYPL